MGSNHLEFFGEPDVISTHTSIVFYFYLKNYTKQKNDLTMSLDSSTASNVPTKSEESPLVPRPFLLCNMKCGFARSTVHSGPLTSTSRGRIHMLQAVLRRDFHL